jgi:hypothetical protein
MYIVVYFIGWILATILYVIVERKSSTKSKSLIIYEGFKWGFFSWVFLVLLLMYAISKLDEYLTNKLK